ARRGEPAPDDAAWTEAVEPDPTLLFRYSALTFNGHRIHYDRDYAMDVEGYGGLVVHGPLLATLMVGLAGRSRPERPISGFEFRGHRPVFDTEAFTVCGRPATEAEGDSAIDVWIANGEGMLAMKGRTTFG
ncbi:MAG: acyl-CoA dehydrogenase, partial [Rhodospirillaceae bacterium]|nr:acyl-CoA dehydrogenase [Rhodospirillaceae bacterium]